RHVSGGCWVTRGTNAQAQARAPGHANPTYDRAQTGRGARRVCGASLRPIHRAPAPRGRCRSGAAAPQPAVAARDEGEPRLVAGPARVFRQLELLLGRVPALAVLAELLHL